MRTPSSSSQLECCNFEHCYRALANASASIGWYVEGSAAEAGERKTKGETKHENQAHHLHPGGADSYQRNPGAVTGGNALPVNPDNFIRAETDRYFGKIAKNGIFGKFHHNRDFGPVDKQPVVRPNRDTLFSTGVFDLDAGPVTVSLPNAGKRFMSMQVIDEDMYTPGVIYDASSYTFTREQIGTRYVLLAVRILVDPGNPDDVKRVHNLQDAIK